MNEEHSVVTASESKPADTVHTDTSALLLCGAVHSYQCKLERSSTDSATALQHLHKARCRLRNATNKYYTAQQ
jgi:hypothetical protein